MANLVNTRCDGTSVTVKDNVNFTINQLPIANAGANKIIGCLIPTVTIGTPAVPGHTYTWSPAAKVNNAYIAQPTTNTPGVYILTVKNTATNCTATSTVTVTSNNTPPVANAGSNKTLTCSGVILGVPAITGYSYSWSPIIGLDNPNIAQPTATKPNTYFLTVTDTSNGCTATSSVVVTGNILIPTANAGNPITLTCANPSAIIGTPAVAGNKYSWAPSAGLSFDNIAQPTVNSAGTYTLTVTNLANGCSASSTVVVSKNMTSPTANAGNPITLTCANPSAIIGTPAVAGNKYSWAPSAGLSFDNIAQPTVNSAGTYTLTVTNLANGCSASSAVVVSTDTTRPYANAGLNKTLTCANPSVTIGSAAIIGNTYSWSPSLGLNASNIAQPTTNMMNNYTITVTNLANGCKSTSQVIVLQNITTSAAVAGEDFTITCTKKNTTIGAPAIEGNSYSWSPALGLNDTTIAQPIVSRPGTYTLTVTNNNNGCTSNDMITIRADTVKPVANAGLDKIINCKISSYTIGTPAKNGYMYDWQTIGRIRIGSVAQPTISEAGVYILTVTNIANGCVSTDDVRIDIDTIKPTADAGEDLTFGCPHTTLTIGTPNIPNMNYQWVQSLGLSDKDIAQPTTDTSGTFVLTVTNSVNHCKSKPDTMVVHPKNCDCDFFVPDAFSPNNDGHNDKLSVFRYCDDFRDFKFSIFNRWGELVFATQDINEGWDGFYKNENQEVDSYVWILEYFDVLYNTKRIHKGAVSLLK